MYLGYDTSQSLVYNNYSLTDSELDTINTSLSSANLYLGDILTETQDISQIFINGLSFQSTVTSNLYIKALYNNLGDITILNKPFTASIMNINLISNNKISFKTKSSLLLSANSSYKIFLQTNKYCLKSSISSLILTSSTYISTTGGSIIEYDGGDISFADTSSYINSSSSTIKISERCSSNYSMAIGGITTPSISDNNTYLMNILSTELSSLYSTNIIFDSCI